MPMNKELLPEQRRPKLKEALSETGTIRLVEVHSGISAMIASNTVGADGGKFDGLWISSLTCSASRGLPDMEMHMIERRIDLIDEIAFASDRPIVVDADTGGDVAVFEYFCRKMETMGVSAVIVEDKRHPKRNSFCGTTADLLEEIEVFSEKISRAKSMLTTGDTLLFARIESLIAGAGLDDALQRAERYLAAGADGIMIHSKAKKPDEVISFSRGFDEICNRFGRRVPLICVPTTYNSVTATELFAQGFNVIIYANHMLRASYQAMADVCTQILQGDSSSNVEERIVAVNDLFSITGYHAAMEREKQKLAAE